ncbi:SRPBCC domain-containing protein [Nonomuraea sp. NPDC050783]|uniref:SRPBCC family protein n=1 Tax=Nonomuraea sp. NPDC050783 TaxID=3154634 RepID=UPI0034662E30
MMQADERRHFTTTVTVDKSPQEAFEGVTDVRGWWSEDVKGVTDQAGAVFYHHYKDVHRCTVQITELQPGRKVVWRVLDNHFDFVTDQGEWKGTDVVFEITGKDGGAEIRFTHVGLVPAHECYDVCANAWSGYIDGSLRDLINTGKGQPNPGEDGDIPVHQRAATAARAGRTEPAGA